MRNSYTCQVTKACIEAAFYTIPFTGSSYDRSSKGGPGWTELEMVEPYRQPSMLWHNLWIECVRPRNIIVSDITRPARAKYHYAIRSVKRDKDAIVRVRFAESFLPDNDRDFLGKAKKLRDNKSLCSNVVDDCCIDADIADFLAHKYRDLYTSCHSMLIIWMKFGQISVFLFKL